MDVGVGVGVGPTRAERPATAEPSTAQLATARPATARPATARPSTAEPSTARVEGALRAAATGYAAHHGMAHLQRPHSSRRGPRWSVPRRLAGVALVAVLLTAGVVALRSQALAAGTPVTLGTPVPAGSAAAPGATVVVHVVGAVASPGVVRLAAGARLLDAVAAAGGSTPDADLSAVNLARPLVDGEQVVVPVLGQPVPSQATTAPTAGDDLVDLNAASLAELDELPGVGPVIAQRIIDRRPFTTIDELDEVSGIGPALLERLRPKVRV